MLAALVAAGAAQAGYLDALLADDGALWPGKLVRYAIGAATGGAWSVPAVGDVTGDGVADLVVGSAYGDVWLYQGKRDGPYGAPQPLLMGGEPEVAPVMRPLAVTVWRRQGEDALLIVIDGRAVYYRATADGIVSGVEMTGAKDESLQDVVGRYGGTAVISAAAEGADRLLVGDVDGKVWRCQVSAERKLGKVSAVAGAEGRQVSVGAPAYVAVGEVGGATELLVGAGRSLWAARLENGRAIGLKKIADAVKTPEGFAAERLAPAIGAAGRVVLGTRYGPVLDARLRDGALDDVRWASAEDVPVDVGLCAAPWAVDWNGDGLKDLVVGSADGHVRLLIARAGGYFEPATLVRDEKGPIEMPAAGGYACAAPALADMDADGDYDLIVGGSGGGVWLWENNKGQFVSRGRVTVGGVEMGGGGFGVATPLDWESDGDTDLLVGRAPQPADDSVALPAAQDGAALRFLQDEADRGMWARFTKVVPVDVMAEHQGTLGDAAYLEPWQALFPGKLKSGERALVLARSGEYLFRLETGGPTYPRLVAGAPDGLVHPWRPRGPVWATCLYGGKLAVGMGPYGFLAMADMPQ
jgi:hypothetical protein